MLYDEKITFQISVSQIGYEGKPDSLDYRRMVFDKVTLTTKELSDYISSGHSVCYLFNANYPMWVGNKEQDRYLGTQVFFFDFDHHPMDAVEFINELPYQPSIAYYTFSNAKDDIRFRLVYVLDEMVFGSKNFNVVYNAISEVNQFGKFDARVENQMYHGTMPERIINLSNIVYSLSDFNVVLSDNSFMDSVPIITSDVKYDFFHKSTTDFLNAYPELSAVHYEAQHSTMIDTGKGYYLYPDNYYEITRTWDIEYDSVTGKERRVQHRVPIGERKKNLFTRGMIFKTNKMDITYEELLYCLSYEVYHFFDNRDNKLDKKVISDTAKSVLKYTSTIKESDKGKYRVDKDYWSEQGISTAQARGYIKKIINKEEFYKHYDNSISISENISNFKNENYSISLATVYRYLKEDNLLKGHISQSKEYNNSNYNNMYNEKLDPLEESIINLIRENDSITIKKMVKVLNVSEKTIKRRIAELKKANKLNRKGGKKTGKWVINDLCKDTVPICLKVSQNML